MRAARRSCSSGLEPDALFALERELGTDALATEADVTDAAATKHTARSR